MNKAISENLGYNKNPLAPKQAARLPSPCIMYSPADLGYCHAKPCRLQGITLPAAVVPCRTVTEARALIRVAGFFALGEGEQAQAVAALIYNGEWTRLAKDGKDFYLAQARDILTLIASGGARK